MRSFSLLLFAAAARADLAASQDLFGDKVQLEMQGPPAPLPRPADLNIDTGADANIDFLVDLDIDIARSVGANATGAGVIVDVDILSLSNSNSLDGLGTPGSACTDEGEWNCLVACYQRCASGRWSETMALAQGTVCTPVGRSHDMHIVEGSGPSNPYCSAESSAAESSTPSAASATSSTTDSSSSSEPSSTSTGTGEFVSGSLPKAGAGPASRSGGMGVVVGVGLVAVVFARLLV